MSIRLVILCWVPQLRKSNSSKLFLLASSVSAAVRQESRIMYQGWRSGRLRDKGFVNLMIVHSGRNEVGYEGKTRSVV